VRESTASDSLDSIWPHEVHGNSRSSSYVFRLTHLMRRDAYGIPSAVLETAARQSCGLTHGPGDVAPRSQGVASQPHTSHQKFDDLQILMEGLSHAQKHDFSWPLLRTQTHHIRDEANITLRARTCRSANQVGTYLQYKTHPTE
jgi:hypothetical protein